MKMNDKNLEQQAQVLLQLSVLPDSYSEGAKKAWSQMQSDYLPDEGRQIFIKKALELGSGKSIREVVDSVYKHGATLPDQRRRTVRVESNRTRPVPPTVTILRRVS
jgi:hypothetical protein